MELELWRIRSRATVVFSACNMTDLRDDVDPRTLEQAGIRFGNCSIGLADPADERLERARPPTAAGAIEGREDGRDGAASRLWPRRRARRWPCRAPRCSASP